jgi:hypothetical protein
MSSNLIAGTAQVTVDGVTYQLEGAAKYMPSTVKREALLGMDGFHGWKETPVAGSISLSIRDGSSFAVGAFNTVRNATVVLVLANGKIVTGRNMGAVDTQEVEAEDGKFELKFEGPQVSEQTVS